MKVLDGVGLAVVAGFTVTGVAMMSPGNIEARQIELEYTLADATVGYAWAEEQANQDAFEQVMTEFFGAHDQPRFPEDADLEGLGIEEGSLDRGREIFRQKCLHCHGTSGGADGPTAGFVNPPPRNFRLGKIKFTSTSRTAPPTRADIARILRNGVAYTAMPSFNAEPDQDIDDLVSYVQFLMMRGATEDISAYILDDESVFEDYEGEELLEEARSYMGDEYFGIEESWLEAEDEIIHPDTPRVPMSEESVARGRDLFMSARTECSACHGENGDGRGPNVYNAEEDRFYTEDDWGNIVRPADLRFGFYRGGNRPLDLYRRIHQGIKGTPMPSFNDSLDSDQIWDLVNYVLSIPYEDEPATAAASHEAGDGH